MNDPNSRTTRRPETSQTKRPRALKRPSANGHRRFPRLVRWAGLSVLAVLVISVLMVLPWRWLAPPTSAFMLYHQRSTDRGIHHFWVPWEQIAPWLPIAVVAAEDQKFPRHRGFDFDSILKAAQERRGRMRGASTISQQVAKNLFLWSGRSYLRKGLEAYLTLLIEALWPKRRILEIYLNVAEFGPGIYGAGAAAEMIFRKPPSRLTLREAALLAAVLPNPVRMSARRPSAYVNRRAGEIAVWVRKLGGPAYLSDL
jgi:monofunctional biosynthetic peptidoglycan transglycosylase